MKKLSKLQIIILLSLLFLFMTACTKIRNESESRKCLPSYVDQIETNLIGIWKSGLPDRSDTLIFREDGTYKQVIKISVPAFDYESGWNKWELRYAKSGVPYLHLKGMNLCVYWEGLDCNTAGSTEYQFYDFCQDEWISMKDEGILVVIETPEGFENTTRDFALFALQKSTTGVTVYQIQDQ